MNTAGTLMKGGMEATGLIFVVVLLDLVVSFSKERKLQRKNYKAHGDIWSGRGRVEGKEEVKRGEEIELFPLLFEIIVIFYFRSPKVQKLSLEKPIFVIFVSIAIYIKRIQNLDY